MSLLKNEGETILLYHERGRVLLQNKKNIIVFMNMKDGVANTTLSVNLAYTLANEFKKKIFLSIWIYNLMLRIIYFFNIVYLTLIQILVKKILRL